MKCKECGCSSTEENPVTKAPGANRGVLGGDNMEEVKKAIAQHIQRLVMQTNWNVVVQPPGTRLNEASVVSQLTTMIRIRTLAGPRFFEVIVKEL